jgi:hypothetical protein
MRLGSVRKRPAIDPNEPLDSEEQHPGPSDLPAWEESFSAPPGEFLYLRGFACLGSAQAVKALLEAENVHCWIWPPYGLFPIAVGLFVEARLAHRARWLLDHDVSDSELTFLATGGLNTDPQAP